MEDIIFVTIDCWRKDAPDVMPRLKTMTEEWNSGSIICSAAATNGVFPAIFASQFYPELYRSDGSVPEDTDSLPTILDQNGYSTGGFVASNPFVGKWSGHFDAWWNDGMSATGVDTNRSMRSEPPLSKKLTRLISLSPQIPAEDVLTRADGWWEQTTPPRFLWVHLMEPHEPYLPGFDLAREIGLFKSYASNFGNKKFDDQSYPLWMQQHRKRLHHQCNKRLDRVLTPWLKSHADSTIILTGDHGEEFDHGLHAHARLYDETVRVPLLSNHVFESLGEEEVVRQLDFAPHILSEFNISKPDSWEGTAPIDTTRPQEMINAAPQLERIWAGIRSESWKIIRTYDWTEGFQESEAYHIKLDPNETEPRSESAAPEELRERLNAFINRSAIEEELQSKDELKTGFNSEVEERLKDLGYME